MTATVARKELLAIKKTAAEFVDQLDQCRRSIGVIEVARLKDHAEKLVCAIADMGDSTRSRLYSYLASCGHDWRKCYEMRPNVYGLFSATKYYWEVLPFKGSASQASVDRVHTFARDTLPLLESIKVLDVAVAVPASGRWGDPALANLIAAVEPIWRRVTNLSGARSSEFESRFATWLDSLLPYVGYSEPVPLGLILDIIRSKKSGTISNIYKTG